MDNMWRGGRATLGRDALRWESAAWPRSGKALALWLERSEARVVTVKVAGLKDERHVMRDVSIVVGKILQELAEEERVVIAERRVGTLPPGDSAFDALVWIDEKEVEQRLKSGERSVELVHNGRRLDIPLYHFDINASSGDVIPNFDAQQLLPREAHDPEFLIHRLGAGDATAPKPPFASRWVRTTVKRSDGGALGNADDRAGVSPMEDAFGVRTDEEAHPDRGRCAVWREGHHDARQVSTVREPPLTQPVRPGRELSRNGAGRLLQGGAAGQEGHDYGPVLR